MFIKSEPEKIPVLFNTFIYSVLFEKKLHSLKIKWQNLENKVHRKYICKKNTHTFPNDLYSDKSPNVLIMILC